jgi:hypothetical protein
MGDTAEREATAPKCASECVAVLRQEWARACERSGMPVAEAHITHVAPLIPTLYMDLQMRCPHGVLWHMQPTSEQIAEWVKEGAE